MKGLNALAASHHEQSKNHFLYRTYVFESPHFVEVGPVLEVEFEATVDRILPPTSTVLADLTGNGTHGVFTSSSLEAC
jgi:hypothetical protein